MDASMNSILGAATTAYEEPLSQTGRLLELETPQGQALFALRAHAVERIGRVARYTVDVINRMRSINPTCQTIGQRFTVAFLASSSMAAELRSLLQTRRAAAAQVRGAATYKAPGR